jgi:hypothetical protein
LNPERFETILNISMSGLEQWAASPQRGAFVDQNVGPTGRMISGLDPRSYLRNFDPAQYAVTFRGDTYQLKPLIEALMNLHSKASAEVEKPDW